MNNLVAEENEFKACLERWHISGRNLVTLPRFTEQGIELKLSIINIDNTRCLTLNKTFYNYESVMSYYGKLIDQLNGDSWP